jgi:hypothetical protein
VTVPQVTLQLWLDTKYVAWLLEISVNTTQQEVRVTRSSSREEVDDGEHYARRYYSRQHQRVLQQQQQQKQNTEAAVSEHAPAPFQAGT